MSTKSKHQGNPNFVKGMKSLNPLGRPKGSVNKYTQLARELLSSRGEEIVEVVIAKALKGDVHCLKINVGTTEQIEEMAKVNKPKRLKTKGDDEVIATIVKEEEN